MDIRKEMREAYYRALYGHLTVQSVSLPIYHDFVSKGLNPDIYGLISTTSNTSSDTIDSFNTEYVSQFTIVVKNSGIADNTTVDNIADQFWQIVEPQKGITGIDPIGFQILTTHKLIDLPRPPYLDGANMVVVERIIQVSNRIFHQ